MVRSSYLSSQSSLLILVKLWTRSIIIISCFILYCHISSNPWPGLDNLISKYNVLMWNYVVKNHINTGVSFFVFILYWNNWNIFLKLLSSYLTKPTFPSFLRTFPRLEWFLNLGRKVEIFFISKCFLFCFVKHFLHLTVYIKYKLGICGWGGGYTPDLVEFRRHTCGKAGGCPLPPFPPTLHTWYWKSEYHGNKTKTEAI